MPFTIPLQIPRARAQAAIDYQLDVLTLNRDECRVPNAIEREIARTVAMRAMERLGVFDNAATR